MARFYRVVRSNPPAPEDFLSLLAEGVAPPDGASEDLVFRWGCVSVFEQLEGARDLARAKPEKGQWIAILEIPAEAPVTLHPKVGRRGHRDIKAVPEILANCVVDVIPARDVGPASAG